MAQGGDNVEQVAAIRQSHNPTEGKRKSQSMKTETSKQDTKTTAIMTAGVET